MKYQVLRRFGKKKCGRESRIGDEVFSTVSWEIDGGEWEDIPPQQLIEVLGTLLMGNTEFTPTVALDAIERQTAGLAVQETVTMKGEKKVVMVFRAIHEKPTEEDPCTKKN